jgi:hypothetical protein
MRYAWDLQPTYLRTERLDRGLKGLAARLMLHRMRTWDHRSAAGVDAFCANSDFVARRILKAYRRTADVIPPPVDVQPRHSQVRDPGLYVTVSRLINYKRVDLLVEAFRQMPDRRLVVIGTGPDAARLRAGAPPNVRFDGYLPVEAMRAEVARARAFLFAAVLRRLEHVVDDRAGDQQDHQQRHDRHHEDLGQPQQVGAREVEQAGLGRVDDDLLGRVEAQVRDLERVAAALVEADRRAHDRGQALHFLF